MKLEKAIEIISKPPTYDNQYLTPDYLDALKLGIEAGKEVLRAREGDPALDGELLPGETED